jgi:hypothetical protein
MKKRPFVLDKYPAFPNIDQYTAESISIDPQEFIQSLTEFSEKEIARNEPFPENQNIKLIGLFQTYKLFEPYKYQIFNVLGIQEIRNAIIEKISGPAFQSRGLFQPLYLVDNSFSLRNSDCASYAGTEFVSPENLPIPTLALPLCPRSRIVPNVLEKNANANITISLHIRRGDYETKYKCSFLLLNEYYYKRALLHIANKINNPYATFKIVCFYERNSTHSANKVIDALKLDQDLSQFQFEYHHLNDILDEQQMSFTDIEEIAAMSHCRHHIIANSTYSWWAAYINPDDSKIVCYPDQYFNHQLEYLSNNGLKVTEWTSIEAWNPCEYKCSCRW